MPESTKLYTETDLRKDESYRHWSPQSQQYASADILLQYLLTGWKIEMPANVEAFYCAGVRRSDVYYFNLYRGDEQVMMPVLASPTVSRLIQENDIPVLRVNGKCNEAH